METNRLKFVLLTLTFILLGAVTNQIYAEDLYWRSNPVNENYNNAANWVTDIANIDIIGEGTGYTASHYPSSVDNVYFTKASTITALKRTRISSAKNIICTAPADVNFTIDGDYSMSIYGSFRSNDNLQFIKGHVSFLGAGDISINQGAATKPLIPVNGSSYALKIEKEAGGTVSLESDLFTESFFIFGNRYGGENINTNGHDITSYRIWIYKEKNAGGYDFSGSTILALPFSYVNPCQLRFPKSFNQPDCRVIIGGEHGSNLTIDDGATDNVVLKSVEFKGKDADLHLSPNYKNVSMTIKEDLIINTSRLDFTAYEIKFIVEGNLKFKRLDTAIQFGGRATQYPENGKYTFTLAGVDFSEASASVCGQQVNWLAWIPTELISSSNSQIEFENTEFQNITFSKGSYSGAGTAFSSPKSGDLIGNSGDITWTASSETAITYYWIGGAGDWNDPAHWSKTSGGTSSGCAPSASDNVIMDNNSGLGNQYSQQTITIPTNAICNNITWTTPGKLTMSANSSLSIRGNADFSGATQISGTVSFLGSDESGNYTLNSGANAIYNECLIVFQNKGTYTLTSPLLSTIKSSILQYGGTFVSGGYKIEVTTISSTISRPATATRNLDLRNSEITFNGNAEPMIVGNAKTFDRTGMGYCYMEGSHFILDGQTMGIRTVGVFEFNNITSISTYNPGLDFVDPGNTINKLTLKENFGISTDAGFTVKDLIMTSGRTYTLGYYIGSAQSEIDKVTVTVTGSIDPGTSDCDKIFFKSDYPSRPAYLKNGTTGTLSMAGADMADIHYIGNSETDKLQVPNGTDRGGLVNVNLTEPEGRDMFWVGNGGNFSDGSHWSFTSGGEASGCVPNRNDNIIFDEKSFTTTNQVVTADYEVEAVNMTWTAEAAAKTPTLRLGKTMTLRGSMLLNQGMNMRSNNTSYERTLNFTGTGNHTIKTDGVSLYLISVNIIGTGNFEMNSDFNTSQKFYVTSSANFDTNGYGISADLVSIVQGTGKTIDISNSSLIGLRDGVVISIANCATYDMENIYVKGAFRFTAPTSCNKSIKKVTSSSVTNTTKNNQLHIGELEMPGNTLDISGYVEADKVIANPELLGGTIKLTAGATLQINEELITRGTPCNYVLISGASSTNKGILKYSACAPELYYTEMENIIGDVSGVSSTCTAEEDGFNGKLIVYGKATLADGNVNVEFRNPITTGEFALPEKRIACAPYPLTFPVGHTVISYQWYKDDIAIPDELGGNTASVEINEDGTYTLYADYGELCTSRISQVVKIDNKHVWTALGAENDWNDEANWDIITIPDICSHVIIPGGLDHYPILKPEHVDGGGNTVGSPKCHTIEFRFGGEVKNTHELTYTLAIVDLTVNGNQWYMLSAPLRNMYVGDIYHTDPAPLKDGYLMEPMYFNQNNPENGRRYGDWSGKFNTSDIEFLPGQGFALWANDIDADYDEQIPVTFTFPKYDPFYYYYNYHGGIEGQSKNLSRVHNGRFIYEPVIDVSKNVLLESSPATKDGDLVFVGNPFMAHLDFDKFAARNSTNIYDEYKLAYGLSADGIMSSFKTYKKINGSYYTTDNADSNLTGLIPPMQSFLVITKVANPQIKANIEETVVAVSGKLPNLKSGLVTYEETPKALEIKLDKSGEYTKTLLLHFNGASNDYLPQEDSYKVFSPYADTPLVVYTKSKDGVALDINSIGNFDEPVSLCISTVQTGEMTISFSGYENFRKHAEIFLKDLLTGTLINISETNKYTFVKNTEEQYIEDRFQLLFTPKDVNSINRIDEPSFVKVYNDLRGNVQIVSDDIITSVIVLDVQGSVIKNITNLNSSTVNMSAYDMSIVNSGVYLLQVVSKGVKSTHKVIIK